MMSQTNRLATIKQKKDKSEQGLQQQQKFEFLLSQKHGQIAMPLISKDPYWVGAEKSSYLQRMIGNQALRQSTTKMNSHFVFKPLTTSSPALLHCETIFRTNEPSKITAQRQNAIICGRDSRRNVDFPSTYIRAINIDLGNISNGMTLDWHNPKKLSLPVGPYEISPGAGKCCVDCDKEEISQLAGKMCTPKGKWTVNRLGCQLSNTDWAKNPTYFSRPGMAIHSGPLLGFPASHGCVRTEEEASMIVHDNVRLYQKKTQINVTGKWSSPECFVNTEAKERENRANYCVSKETTTRDTSKQIYNTIQAKSFAKQVQENIGIWVSDNDIVQAIRFLASLNNVDFNDTIIDLKRSGELRRILGVAAYDLLIRFSHLLGDKGTRMTCESVVGAMPVLFEKPELSLIIFGRKFAETLGPKNPPPSASFMKLISSNPSAAFTGSGATGVNPTEAPINMVEMLKLYEQSNKAKKGKGIEYYQYNRVPGFEMLYDWSNPIKGHLTGSGSYIESLSDKMRQNQAHLLFERQINTLYPEAYRSALPTRIQIVRAAAKKHRLDPSLIAAIILAEQRDQSQREDAVDYMSASLTGRSSSIGLGQVTVNTARKEGLFRDFVSSNMSQLLSMPTRYSKDLIPQLLSSDEFNIFAVARYLRIVANLGARKDIHKLPHTQQWVGQIDLSLFAKDSSNWTRNHIMLIGSEYTSKPFDDTLVPGWGEFVLAAYDDIKAAGIFR